jgi:8-oxo-dGTP pyrophosphatase MutT (NUDIX family)/phosphohistidine phosphatase SixA
MVSKPIRAAGGVVWRTAPDHANDSAIEVAVVHRPRYDDWTLPKGKLGAGETLLDGALREVFEETGYRVRPGRALGDVSYMKSSNGEDREKFVHYWAMEAVGGAFTPSREVDELAWISPEGAEALLTRGTDREILQRFVAGPVRTGTVLLVRHASAGDRARWEGDDRLRPLDELGREQAQELVRLLSRFEVQKLVAADYARCVQTLEPLAGSIGLEIERNALFSETGFPGHEQEAIDAIRMLGDHDDAVAVCSQRQVIPDVVGALGERDGVSLPNPFKYKKASVWALSFEGEKLAGAEYFPPPQLD